MPPCSLLPAVLSGACVSLYIRELGESGRQLSEKGIKNAWMASFKSSPGEYLEECLSLLRDYKVPISEYDGGTRLKQTLTNFYADMMVKYERG